MELSVIIPVYNAEKTIRDCVLSVLNSDFDKNFEIIAVDDGSTDKSIEKIKDLKIRIIRQKNKGAATARNNGARHAKSNLIVFVDSDVTLFKDTLKRVYEHLKKEGVDYVSGRYSKKPINQKWIHKYKALADYSYYYDMIFTKEQKQKPLKQVAIIGAVEGYKKGVFKEIGGFNERIKGAHTEQEDIRTKLLQKYNMISDGNIKSRHNFPDFIPLVKTYFNRTFDNMGLMHNKKYDQPYLKKNIVRIALAPLTLISLIVSIFFFVVFGYTFPFFITFVLFSCYFISHIKLFLLALKEYGFFFMLYTLAVNIFFCCLIAFAGFLGTIKIILGGG